MELLALIHGMICTDLNKIWYQSQSPNMATEEKGRKIVNIQMKKKNQLIVAH